MDNQNPDDSSQEIQQQPQQRNIENPSETIKKQPLGNTSWLFVYLAVFPIGALIGFETSIIFTLLLIFVFPYEFASAYAVIFFFIFDIFLNSIFIFPILLLLAGAIRKKRISKTTILLLILIIIFYVSCIYSLAEIFSKNYYQKFAVPISVGDEVKLPTINITINDIKEQKSLISSSGNVTTAKENSKFVVIGLDITSTINIDNVFYPNNNLKFVDDSGTEYQAYSDSIGAIGSYLNPESTTPPITETGIVVYEVPLNSSKYTLYIFNSNNGDVYKLELN